MKDSEEDIKTRERYKEEVLRGEVGSHEVMICEAPKEKL